jgi:signal recognition particle subunit SRP54
MGDIVGLVRDFEGVIDEKEAEQAEADAQRLLKGQFGLDDLLKQLKMIQRMGPLREVVSKLPMFGAMAEQVDEGELVKVESLIGSMTPTERTRPEIIDKSRAARIARGSGRRSRDVRNLVDRLSQMRQMMASLGSKGGLLSKLPGMGNLAGAGAGGLDPSAFLGGGAEAPSRQEVAKRRSQQKGKRKQARKSRKKNRRR